MACPWTTDNGYRAGAAGDIDGDSRDEIVIMRDNKIRTYPDANVSTICDGLRFGYQSAQSGDRRSGSQRLSAPARNLAPA